MKRKIFFSILVFTTVSLLSSAQVIVLPNNLGINTTNPLSSLSVNDDGDVRYGIYSISNSTASGNTGMFGEGIVPLSSSGSTIGVRGIAPAGSGFAYGLRGDATSSIPSSSGRSYGIFGSASNSTAGFNYGVWGQLVGSNEGTGILGWDRINHTWNEDVDGFWAGYFVGDTHISEKLTIGTTNMPTTVGVNTLTNYRLFVCGGILAEEWLVPSATWCDYVFEEDYDLKPLAEVEQHIEENGYLHNTPSAKEIETNGLEMTKITINQQEKIEELFLHMIEMDKRLKALEEKKEQLEQENEALKTKLK